MGPTLRLVAGWCLLALAAGAAGAGAAPRQSDTAPALTRSHDPTLATVVSGELVVRLRSGQATAVRSAVLRAEGVHSVDSLGVADLVHVELAPGTDLEEAAAELESRPGVVYAEPNRISRISVLPNDPMLGAQWGLSQPSGRDIDAPSAWNQVTGSSSVIVAVIDTGVAYAHPDLNDNMWVNNDPPGGGDEDGNTFVDDLVGWDFVDDDAAPLDFNGHGTHVAGTIGAEGNNARGIAGVSWDVSIMALRAGDAYGGFTDSAVAAAIGYACANGADVVNGSFGSRELSPPIRDAVAAAACQGTLFVFAAGNEGRSLDGNTTASNSYPCELHRPPANAPNVLCVGASGRSDGIASFSNRGPLAVHLAAPGVGIRSTRPVFSRLPGFPEGFESSSSFAGRWGARAGGAPAWGRSTVRRQSGRWSLADSPAGNYPNSRARSIRRDPSASGTAPAAGSSTTSGSGARGAATPSSSTSAGACAGLRPSPASPDRAGGSSTSSTTCPPSTAPRASTCGFASSATGP